MKTIKFIMLGVLVAFSSTLFAQEQSKTTPEMRAQKITQDLTKELSLTKDQIVKIKPLNLEMSKKWSDIKTNGAEANKPFLTKMEAKYKAILTADQFTKFKALVDKSLKKMEAKRTETANQNQSLKAVQPKQVKVHTIKTLPAKQLKTTPIEESQKQ